VVVLPLEMPLLTIILFEMVVQGLVCSAALYFEPRVGFKEVNGE